MGRLVNMDRRRRFIGMTQMIRDVDALVARGDLKPIWSRAVRRPEFEALLIRLTKLEATP